MQYDNIDFASIPEDQIESKECRFSVYLNPNPFEMPDAHYIKETIHLKDGRTIPNVRIEFDRPRSFWVTRKGFRNTHKQHKEWEYKERLQEFFSPERFLHKRIGAALNKPFLRTLRDCRNEPHVYGIDITSTACIKQEYMKKWSKTTGYSIAEFDIEADVVDGTDVATIASLSMPPTNGQPARCYTFITKQYIGKHPNFLQELEEKTQEVLTPLIKKYRDNAEKEIKFKPPVYDIEYKSEIVENHIQLWIKVFQLCHEWQPDFLSIWNMEYEMKKLVEACERENIDPREFMCDPRIPKEYRYFEYIEGKEKRVTASDKKMPVKPAARWHHVELPATFFIIDQMCVYKQTRMGEQEEASYTLDAIMQKEIKLSKLHVEAAEHIPHATLEWHMFMQRHCKVEYAVYNRFDVLGPQFIEEKDKGMGYVLPSMSATSDARRFPSQPKRACDALHWYVQELAEPRVMGVSPSKREDEEYDDETIERDGWVVTLPAALIMDNGLQVIKQLPGVPTRVYGHVGDLDVSASYPNGEVALNTSRETTIREPMEIDGIPEEIWRLENMGISGGHVNAYAWCNNILNFPSHEEVLREFVRDTGIQPLVSFEEAREALHGAEALLYDVPEGLQVQDAVIKREYATV